MRSHNRLYTLLNVLPDADPVVIEAAYKALIKRHHPDIHRHGTIVGDRTAAELNQAYQTLRDPDRRAAYDADERARQERHRAELARALQPPTVRAVTYPSAPEPASAGQRAAAWIGALGIAALGGAIYLLAQGDDSSVPAPIAAASEPAAVPTAKTAQAFRDQPVNRGEIEAAVSEFRRIAQSTGLSGAAEWSERCFDGQSRTLRIVDFDRCVAFDHVASRADLRPPAESESRQDVRFQPQSLVSRHIRAAERIVRDPSLIEARLFEIRRQTDSILGQRAAAATPPPRRQAAAAVTPPLQILARQPEPRSAQPVRQAPAEPDFLERQGGIY
jgi:curved DNA-binding protein CbpA